MNKQCEHVSIGVHAGVSHLSDKLVGGPVTGYALDGRVVLRWLKDVQSLGIYGSVSDVLTVHGHNGSTALVWNEEEWDA